MGRFQFRQLRDKKVLAGLLLLPLAVSFVAGVGMPWSGFNGSSPIVEAKAAMFAPPPKIDGQRAYGYLKKICEIGPRTAGSKANTRQREMVKEHFKKMGATVREQPFWAEHPQTGQRLLMVNLVASWHPERLERVVIGAHYDTRPFADQEDDPVRHAMPFLGANDGASGVALLMELAHHMKDLETPWGVDLVLFDGEELVFGNNPRVGEYFLGSTEFARIYANSANRRRSGSAPRYVAGFVLDMVGGRNLEIKQEKHSLDQARELVRQVWAVARYVDARSFTGNEGHEVMDDHVPLNKVGIPTIDIIDFDYPYWHKAGDLPENCSAESLEEVGRVLAAWLGQPRAPTSTPTKRRR